MQRARQTSGGGYSQTGSVLLRHLPGGGAPSGAVAANPSDGEDSCDADKVVMERVAADAGQGQRTQGRGVETP